MSTDLELRLREAFAARAERARLVNPNGPPALDAPPLVDDPYRPHRSRWVAVAAVAAASRSSPP